MKLLIAETVKPEFNDTYAIDFFDFRDKAYHPFIATKVNNWEVISIEVNDNTPRGYIKQLLPLSNLRAIILTDTLSLHQVQVLCEMYPDVAGRLKTLYMSDQVELRRLVDELSGKV